MIPHKNFVGRMEGRGTVKGPARRKHNGRLRRLPHRGILKSKDTRAMRRMDWYFGTNDGWEVFVRKTIRATNERS